MNAMTTRPAPGRQCHPHKNMLAQELPPMTQKRPLVSQRTSGGLAEGPMLSVLAISPSLPCDLSQREQYRV
jgi:hypothetical protein